MNCSCGKKNCSCGGKGSKVMKGKYAAGGVVGSMPGAMGAQMASPRARPSQSAFGKRARGNMRALFGVRGK